MMFWTIGYVALVAYAAGLFTWAAAHNREGAAVGILLSISGLQLAVMETVDPAIGAGIAIAGIIVIARDIAMTLGGRVIHLAPAISRTRSARPDEIA
ncbi:MAG: hypothetical protein ACRD1H_16500 [Vicinamibacterales bacterium]